MEQSFGIVPIAYTKGTAYVFIIQNYSLAWLMPKGHANPGESPTQTAQRELFEETGLSPTEFLHIGPFAEEYTYTRANKQIHKRVVYFPALVQGQILLQLEEIRDGKWVPLSSLETALSFPELKEIARQVCNTLLPKPGLV